MSPAATAHMANIAESPYKHSRDIYTHFVRHPTSKTFCLVLITGVVQALLLTCVAIDYKSKWSNKWLAVTAGSMVSENRTLLVALALCKVASLAALLYYVHSEALAAAALLQLVAQSSAASTGANVNSHARNSPFMVFVPLWQLTLAVGIQFLQSFIFAGYYLPAGYGSLTINQDSALITDVIFAAVALCFVLDLDNKAFEMLHIAPDTFSMASMYSAVFADDLLPKASYSPSSSVGPQYSGLHTASLGIRKLVQRLNASRLAKLVHACAVCVFHIIVILYTSFTLSLATVFSLDVFPECIPADGDIKRIVAVVIVSVVIFVVFQLVLGIWLPPPASSTAACEAACKKAGRGYVLAQCRVSRWYALACNTIVPLITAVVNMVVHQTTNANVGRMLAEAEIGCDTVVNEQLLRTGGANISCRSEEVDMTKYVSDLFASRENGTNIPICNTLGIHDLFACSSLWFLAIPMCSLFMAAALFVLVPLLVAIKRQQPCGLCAVTVSDMPHGSECPASAVAVATESAFAVDHALGLDERKSV